MPFRIELLVLARERAANGETGQESADLYAVAFKQLRVDFVREHVEEVALGRGVNLRALGHQLGQLLVPDDAVYHYGVSGRYCVMSGLIGARTFFAISSASTPEYYTKLGM